MGKFFHNCDCNDFCSYSPNLSFQVTVPLGFYDKYPISVSLIARYGGDRFLLDTLKTMYTSLQEQADIAATSKASRNVVSKEQSAEIAKEKVLLQIIQINSAVTFFFFCNCSV